MVQLPASHLRDALGFVEPRFAFPQRELRIRTRSDILYCTGGKYGCSVIGLCAGDGAIPKTAEERVQNAAKIIEEADKLGIPAADIVIDPIVLTLGTEWKAAKMVLEAIRMIVDRFGVNITMGASNVSFGMPDRENLTAFFMALSVEAGLSCPICNPLKKQEVTALQAADLIMGRDPHGMKWIKGFRARQAAS